MRKAVFPKRADAADATDFGDSTIGAYEAGSRTLPSAYVTKLCEVSGVSPEWVYDGKPTPPPINAVITAKTDKVLGNSSGAVIVNPKRAMHLNLVPYWGSVPAGNWQAPPTEPEWIQVSESVDTNGVVAVRVTGSSMEPRLLHGQLVCIKLDSEPKDGVISLLQNQDHELTLKVPHYVEGAGWEFHSINPAFPNATADQVTTLGYAISLEETNLHGIRP